MQWQAQVLVGQKSHTCGLLVSLLGWRRNLSQFPILLQQSVGDVDCSSGQHVFQLQRVHRGFAFEVIVGDDKGFLRLDRKSVV